MVVDVDSFDISQVSTETLANHMQKLSKEAKGKYDNTRLAYDPKEEEWNQYCEKIYHRNSPESRYTVTPDKARFLLFYQAFREKKQQGRKADGAKRVTFDYVSFVRIMKNYHILNLKDPLKSLKKLNRKTVSNVT